MELLFTILLLNILRHFSPDFAKSFSKIVNTLRYHNENVKISQKRCYLRELEAEQREYNMIDDFAKHAKLQRKIDKITAELKVHSENKSKSLYLINLILRYSLQAMFTLTLLYFCLAYRSHPVIYLPEKYTSYFSVVFSFPGGEPGTVSCFFWAAACRACVVKIADSIKERYGTSK